MAPSGYATPEVAPVPDSVELSALDDLQMVKPAKDANPVVEFWFSDIYSALELARRENRPVLVHFYTQGCVPCRRMEAEVFSNSEIKKTTADYYIPVKIDGSQNLEVAQKFFVKSYPCDFILNPDGKIISKSVGLQTQMSYQTFLSQTAQRMGFKPLSAREEIAVEEEVAEVVEIAEVTNVVEVAKVATRETSEEEDSASDSVAESEPELEPEDSLPAPPFAEQAPEEIQVEEEAPILEVPKDIQFEKTAESTQGSSDTPVSADSSVPLLLDGYCPVALVERREWVKGDVRYGVRHRGCLYLFESKASMDLFFVKPDYYALASEGMDVVTLTDSGEHKPGLREFGIRYDNMNFVFSTAENRETFRKNPENYVDEIRQNILETARARSAEER